MDIAFRAKKILGRMERFHLTPASTSEEEARSLGLPVRPSERVLGWYENGGTQNVAVTTSGIYINGLKGWKYVAFGRMRKVDLKLGDLDLRGIDIRLDDDELVQVPWTGGHGVERPACEFARFIMRVTNATPYLL